MFISCNKNLHIKEGAEELNLKNGFIGEIDDRWAKHWFIQSAISDGTILSTEAGKKPKRGKKDSSEETDKADTDTGDDQKSE